MYEIDAGGLSPTVELAPAELCRRLMRRARIASQAQRMGIYFLPYLKRFCYNKVTDNGPNLREKTR